MDTAQWPQEILVKPMEEIIPPNTCSSSLQISNHHNSVERNNSNSNNKGDGSSTTITTTTTTTTASERKVRPQKDQAVNCPRCNSTNTKFCYYNNYSLTQPRYFCKTCRRYWTEGGSLRNIPVGGGSRKNKRSTTSSSNYSSNYHNNHTNTSKKLALNSQTLNPKHLNLGFPPNTTHQEFRSLSEFTNLPIMETTPKTLIPNPSSSSSPNHHQLSALELLNGLTSSSRGGLTPFMPMPMPMSDPNGVYSSSSSGFPSIMQDFKPTLNFSLDGFGGYNGSLQGQQPEPNGDNNGRLLFPFEDLKQVSSNNTSAHNDSSTNDHQQARDQQGGDSSGYWSGMLGMGGSW